MFDNFGLLVSGKNFNNNNCDHHFAGDELDQWVASKCADKVDQAFHEVKQKGRGVAAFICEPCFVSEIIHKPLIYLVYSDAF